jgi:two-component system, response regulator
MRILHVEDDDAMAVIFRTAVEEARIDAILFRVSNGEQALDYLRGDGPYVGSKAPDCVFLDLNMPRVDGWQVLTTMRADKNLRAIPVVILSTSFRQVDKDRADGLGAMHCIAKPVSFEPLVIAVRSVYRKLVATRSASGGA